MCLEVGWSALVGPDWPAVLVGPLWSALVGLSTVVNARAGTNLTR